LTDFDPKQIKKLVDQAERLFSAQDVENKLEELAQEINRELSESNPILVCIMNGGIVPFGILLPKLTFPCEVDYVHATRYQGNLTGSELKWICGPKISPKGRTVLLVDDVLDEGTTLAAIEKRYRQEGALDVKKALMVIKDRERDMNIEIEYKGLSVPDRYVFGYGMDYKGYWRNAQGIFAERETK